LAHPGDRRICKGGMCVVSNSIQNYSKGGIVDLKEQIAWDLTLADMIENKERFLFKNDSGYNYDEIFSTYESYVQELGDWKAKKKQSRTMPKSVKL